MRISDWSSDMCSSDLGQRLEQNIPLRGALPRAVRRRLGNRRSRRGTQTSHHRVRRDGQVHYFAQRFTGSLFRAVDQSVPGMRTWLHILLCAPYACVPESLKSEEHTSELQSLMSISYAVFCLKKQKNTLYTHKPHNTHN